MVKTYFKIEAAMEEKISALIRECHEQDGGGTSPYLFEDAMTEAGMEGCKIPPFYSISKKGEIVAFLGLFATAEDNIEISAFTRPDFRRRGYFTRLLRVALRRLRRLKTAKILLVAGEHTPALGAIAREVSRAIGATPEGAEYQLKFDKMKSVEYHNTCIFIVPMDKDFTVREIKKLFFGGMESITAKACLLEGENVEFFNFADSSGSRIGLSGIYKEGATACIFNFGIVKEHWRKGFGRQALGLLVEELLKRGFENIVLQVSSENKAAYELYINNNFIISQKIGYYKLQQKRD